MRTEDDATMKAANECLGRLEQIETMASEGGYVKIKVSDASMGLDNTMLLVRELARIGVTANLEHESVVGTKVFDVTCGTAVCFKTRTFLVPDAGISESLRDEGYDRNIANTIMHDVYWRQNAILHEMYKRS